MRRKEDKIKLIATLVISVVLGLVISWDKLFEGIDFGKNKPVPVEQSVTVTGIVEPEAGDNTASEPYRDETVDGQSALLSEEDLLSAEDENVGMQSVEATVSQEVTDPTDTPAITEEPAPETTEAPSPEATEEPVPEPTETPTEEPVPEPTETPTEEPVPEPTEAPIEQPTPEPIPEVEIEPTLIPTLPPVEDVAEESEDETVASETEMEPDTELIADSDALPPDDVAGDDEELGLTGTTYMPDSVVPIPGHEGIYQNPPLKAEANAFLGSKGEYVGTMAMDGKEETSWQFSTKNAELGKVYLDIWVPEGSIVDELWFKNGFWKITQGYDQYTRNSRPKKIGVSFCYDGQTGFKDEIEILLNDDKVRADWQVVSLGRHENVKAIRLRIISIYQGSKFKTDVALSEVMIVQRDDRSAMVSYTPLKRGDKGPEVQRMKERLQELGYFKANSDVSDVYNETCEERVEQFQKKNNLPVTGDADSATLSVLYSQSAIGK